jgi:hypothetical protein
MDQPGEFAHRGCAHRVEHGLGKILRELCEGGVE